MAMPDIPRTPTEHAAQDERMAGIVLGHPIRSNFPKPVVEALAAVTDGEPTFDNEGVHLLVRAALAAVVGAEIHAGRGART
jgi:hypothetical protein